MSAAGADVVIIGGGLHGCSTALHLARAGVRAIVIEKNYVGRHASGVQYLEIVPNQRLRYTDRFDDPILPGQMVATITVAPVSCGTELHVVQEGIPEVIPLEACYLGWQESLVLLGKLVEAEIPGP